MHIDQLDSTETSRETAVVTTEGETMSYEEALGILNEIVSTTEYRTQIQTLMTSDLDGYMKFRTLQQTISTGWKNHEGHEKIEPSDHQSMVRTMRLVGMAA